MRILHSIRSVNPDGGGVIEAVRQFSLAHQQAGHEVEVVSLDAPGETWVDSCPLKLTALGPTGCKYGYSAKFTSWIKANLARFDCVIVDGLWQYNGLGVHRALAGTDTPYVVFPHGMLDPWFKQTYPLKHLKKWLYWPWAEYRVLRDARRVFFTCAEEQLLARQSFWLYRANEEVASLGIQPPPGDGDKQVAEFFEKFPKLRNRRLLLFLGRIHVKKGCDLLIEAFAEAARRDANLQLVMAGPDQTGWQSELQQRSAALGIAECVTWLGMVGGDLKWSVLRAADAFILPSHQENFGIAVAEAMACGVPVLISDKVNIWREIVEDGAGAVAPDTLAGTKSLIGKWQGTDPVKMSEWRSKARTSFEKRFEISRAAEALIQKLRAAGVRN